MVISIETKGVWKSYGSVWAVKDLNLEVRKGEIFGLLGPNGAGKTTTLKILTFLTKPDRGSCKIEGLDIWKYPLVVKSRISVIPQEINLDKELNAYENLLIYCMLHKIRDKNHKIEEALRFVGLWEYRKEEIRKFSLGMQKRLLLARSFLNDPSVIFLDEPTTGLDPQIRREIWTFIKKAKDKGKTILLTTHYIEEAEYLCDRVAIMNKGEIIACGTPQELKNQVGLWVLESLNDAGFEYEFFKTREEALLKAREKEGPVTIRKSNLEDIFIRLTGEKID